MVMMMILAMTMVPAFAIGSNITQITENQYTTFMSASNPAVFLFATTTTNFTDNLPFDSDETYDIEWGWTEDGTTIVGGASTSDGQLSFSDLGLLPTGVATALGVTPDTAPTGGGNSYATAVVYFTDLNIRPAVYSLVVKMGTSSANFTIVVESTTDQAAVNATVKIVDATSTPVTLLSDTAVTVNRSNLGGVLNGKADALQRNPSAMGVLDTLVGLGTGITPQINSFTVNTSGSYVDTITIGGVPYAPTGSPNFYGWQYGVYRNVGGTYTLVGISSVVSASAFPLQANDRIMWVYGAYGSVPATW